MFARNNPLTTFIPSWHSPFSCHLSHTFITHSCIHVSHHYYFPPTLKALNSINTIIQVNSEIHRILLARHIYLGIHTHPCISYYCTVYPIYTTPTLSLYFSIRNQSHTSIPIRTLELQLLPFYFLFHPCPHSPPTMPSYGPSSPPVPHSATPTPLVWVSINPNISTVHFIQLSITIFLFPSYVNPFALKHTALIPSLVAAWTH